MRTFALVALLAASALWAQEPVSNPQQPPSPVQAPAPAASQKQTITIPSGTRIPLALASPITTKARPGNAVRAVTGFPVTVGTRLAIPAGAYVEGVIDKVTKRGRSGPSLRMHFTRILYANGYSVAIDGANTQAKALHPGSSFPEPNALAGGNGAEYALGAESSSQLPAIQPPPSHLGVILGVAVGSAVAGIVAIVLTARHRGGGNGVLFDTGWQFEMVLQSPLTVDAASVAAAVVGSGAQ